MNNLIKSYSYEDENRRGDPKPPSKNKFDFKKYKDNTMKSLNETEYFLNHIRDISKYIRIYKIFK